MRSESAEQLVCFICRNGFGSVAVVCVSAGWLVGSGLDRSHSTCLAGCIAVASGTNAVSSDVPGRDRVLAGYVLFYPVPALGTLVRLDCFGALSGVVYAGIRRGVQNVGSSISCAAPGRRTSWLGCHGVDPMQFHHGNGDGLFIAFSIPKRMDDPGR